MPNIDTCRSYATEDALERALAKWGIVDHLHVVVCNRAGRFAAVFPCCNVNTDHYGQAGNVMLYANRGFMTLG